MQGYSFKKSFFIITSTFFFILFSSMEITAVIDQSFYDNLKLQIQVLSPQIIPEGTVLLYAEIKEGLLHLHFSSHFLQILDDPTKLETLGAELTSLTANRPEINGYRFIVGGVDLGKFLFGEKWDRKASRQKVKTYSTKGDLSGISVAISPGHGWYYNESLGQWVLQRDYWYGIVEDLINMEIAWRLAEYLENAGAKVYFCRERGKQLTEIIIDNLDSNYAEYGGGWNTGTYRTPYGIDYRWHTCSSEETAWATFSFVPQNDGLYPIYHWFTQGSNRATDSQWSIFHSGGRSDFYVNQSINGERWNYLGSYYFFPENNYMVKLGNKSISQEKVIIADAVRIGAGYGTIQRGGTTSGHPRWEEGAKYFIEYLGAPASVYQQASTERWSDVNSRPLYANWQGVDCFISIHNNASGTHTASGTETYYYSGAINDLLNQQLAQSVHSSVISVIRSRWDSSWIDRGVRDYGYNELAYCNVPCCLIELAFFDNPSPDNAYLHEPEFLDLCGRGIYEGIASYFQANVSPPAPPQAIYCYAQGNNIELIWKPEAGATGYLVKKSFNGKGFDDGEITFNNYFSIANANPEEIYYFSIHSLNQGGKSPHSSVVACKIPSGTGIAFSPVLIIDGFNRIDRYVSFEDNTMDFVIQHSQAFRETGVSFDSCSNEAVIEGLVNIKNYQMIDWIAGEESTADESFSAVEQNIIIDYLNQGGSLFVSGSEIGWDLDYRGSQNDKEFYNQYLKARFLLDDAGVSTVIGVENSPFFRAGSFNFSDGSYGCYNVDYPDVIEPLNGSLPALSYVSPLSSTINYAAIYYSGDYKLVYFAFPFEAIYPAEKRAEVMGIIYSFLIPPTPSPTPTLTLSPTITPTLTPSPIPSSTPTSTCTLTPSLTATLIPSSTPSPTSTPPLTPTLTPTSSPSIKTLMGYWNTRLTSANGGHCTIKAIIYPFDASLQMEIFYDGWATGIYLYDNGRSEDFEANDGIYGLGFDVPPEIISFRYLIEVEVRNRFRQIAILPFLKVK